MRKCIFSYEQAKTGRLRRQSLRIRMNFTLCRSIQLKRMQIRRFL